MTFAINLELFSGPMDLLLYLVREHELDIHDVTIAQICDLFLESLSKSATIDVEGASDFLVMASTLMLLKSRSLLPQEEVDLDEELSPEDDLIGQLLEFKRFKTISRDLDERLKARSQVTAFFPPGGQTEVEFVPLEDLDVWDLVRAFSRILKETGLHQPRLIAREKPLRELIEEVVTALSGLGRATLAQVLLTGGQDRFEIIGRFIAILDLAFRKAISITFEQDEYLITLVDHAAATALAAGPEPSRSTEGDAGPLPAAQEQEAEAF